MGDAACDFKVTTKLSLESSEQRVRQLQYEVRAHVGAKTASPDQIIAGGKRKSAPTRDLLEYSRVSSTEDRSAQSVDLNQVVAQTREFLGKRLREVGTVESDSLPTIQGPEVRIAQVFRNLFENA